jgi:hypothetical protein
MTDTEFYIMVSIGCVFLLILCIGAGLIISRAKEMQGPRYPMCKDQPAQIDCRVDKCKYYTGAGACSNVSPAITLNANRTFVCWSKDIEKEN